MKRGATVVNFILIIGLLFIAMIVVVNMQKIVYFQASQVEIDVAKQFVKDIRLIIERGQAYPSDMTTEVKVPFFREYDLKLSQGLIELYFPREELSFSEPFSVADLNLMENEFSDAGIIYIYTKNRNFLVTDIPVTSPESCNTADTRCDPGCVYNEVCDPACYDAFLHDVCNPHCVDQNGDGLTNGDDFDGICDPDCYNSHYNGGYYDVDCIESFDGICDPDTNNVKDMFCDADCNAKDGICDPDCGRSDADCPYIPEDGVCETDKGENCEVSVEDCQCEGAFACRPGCVAYHPDEKGCVAEASLKSKRQLCDGPCDCRSDLTCMKEVTDPSKSACCGFGEFYVDSEPSKCVDIADDGRCWEDAPFNEDCSTEPACCECQGPAYLHGDLWDYWYNGHICCDPQYKSIWRCNKLRQSGLVSSCSAEQQAYNSCKSAHGVGCIFTFDVCDLYRNDGSYIDDCEPEQFNYDNFVNTFYGKKYGDDCEMTKLSMQVIDKSTGTVIQTLDQCKKQTPGSFACLQIPISTSTQIEVRASGWGTFFGLAQTSAMHGSWPPVVESFTAEPGRHYVWDATGINVMADCTGPPSNLKALYPGASCSTKT